MAQRRASMRSIAEGTDINVADRMQIITRLYGITLTQQETRQIATTILSDFDSRRSRRLERMEDAILSYLRENNPGLANQASAIIEGNRLWAGLSITDVPIPSRTRQGTSPEQMWIEQQQTFGEAIIECRALQGAEKQQRFAEIVTALAEVMRVRGGEGEQMTNPLGHVYDIFASDISEVYGQGRAGASGDGEPNRINCFSGSIALGLMVRHAARLVGLDDEVDAQIRQVASVNMGGGRWDDTGHGLLEVRIGSERLFYDTTNAGLDWQGTRFEYIEDRNFLQTTRGRRVRYYLGSSFPIDGNMMHIARVQDQLMENTGDVDDAMARRLSGLPPLFMSYLLNSISPARRIELFRRMGTRGIGRVSHPSERFRLATIAAVLFRHSDAALAHQFGTLALESLEQATSDERYLAALPMGRFLNNAIVVADMVGRTRQGADLVRRSRIWTYIPVVTARSATTIEPSTARTALDFMARFHGSNIQLISSQTPLVQFNILRGMIHLQRLAGSGPRGGVDSRETIRELYGMLGINMEAALTQLAESVNLQIPRGRAGGSDIRSLFATSEVAQQLEEQFLRSIHGVLMGRFSLQEIRIARVRVSPQGRIIADAIIALYSSENTLNRVIAQEGHFRRAAELLGLV